MLTYQQHCSTVHAGKRCGVTVQIICIWEYWAKMPYTDFYQLMIFSFVLAKTGSAHCILHSSGQSTPSYPFLGYNHSLKQIKQGHIQKFRTFFVQISFFLLMMIERTGRIFTYYFPTSEIGYDKFQCVIISFKGMNKNEREPYLGALVFVVVVRWLDVSGSWRACGFASTPNSLSFHISQKFNSCIHVNHWVSEINYLTWFSYYHPSAHS